MSLDELIAIARIKRKGLAKQAELMDVWERSTGSIFNRAENLREEADFYENVEKQLERLKEITRMFGSIGGEG